MLKKLLFTYLVSLFSFLGFCQNNIISLNGEWEVRLDPESESLKNCQAEIKTSGKIDLPGSLAEYGFGCKTTGSDFGILTPEFKYIGKALYTREIKIPEKWKNKEVVVMLERVLWESRIFIDGIALSRQDALGTPHLHKLGKIAPGKHKITIQVDNEMIHNIGDKGHAYGEYTQSIWNGIVGRMEMIAKDPVHIESVRIFPDIKTNHLKVEITPNKNYSPEIDLNYEIHSIQENKTILAGKEKISFNNSGITQLSILTKNKLQKWSEFNPETYLLKLKLEANEFSDEYETEFGFYEVSQDGTKILINGNPVFLRGNLDCVHFPLTGYPSCKVEDWERIFRIYKDYGLNHARFHSWCPPEAAFIAANRVGIYLQAEASIWIDWWMSVDNTERGRPEMNTKGFPKGLGYDPPRDSFVVAEMNRVVDVYGNHPSFTLFCIGNELGNSDFDVMKKWVADLKEKDNRRLYAVSTAREITDVDDYSATHNILRVGRTRGLNGPRTDWDFEETYGKMNIPIIAHEIGQWPVYPRWSEIKKYTGVLKARNLQEFKNQAEKNGIAEQGNDFANASGALNQIMYKYETESFLRTKSCAGVQLLSMQDYQGQGEALIGWLDCHWESKGITTPEKFRQHFTTTVPLLRMEKFVWQNNEIFSAQAQIAHHGQNPLNARCTWKILNEKNSVIAQSIFAEKQLDLGSLTDLGEIRFNLSEIEKAEKFTVSIKVDKTDFENSWDFWVYPRKLPAISENDILVVDEINDVALQKLEDGAKVLLLAGQLGNEKTSVYAHFYPLYWSLTFFPGQGKTCIGLLLDEENPAFKHFPTSFHSDWQWETISEDAKGFVLNDLPASYRPVAQPVDDFHRNNKIGSVFELKVGKGKLLVCGYNLNSELPVARQLKYSLLNYMNSPDFNPGQQVEKNWLKTKFPSLPKAETVDLPDGFEGSVLYVQAGAYHQKENSSVPWKPELDKILLAEKTNYRIKSDGVWKDSYGTAWHGKEMEITINCEDGILGSLYIHFHDWNNNNRSGEIEFEGRKVKLDKHDDDGKWVKFHVMREDSNDGKLVVKTKALTGPNLMITKLVLIKE